MSDVNRINRVKIKNYRAFESLEINGFSRVNVIGGLNGIGKTTLLEALFHVVDYQNPLTLVRPHQFRQIPLGPMDVIDAIRLCFHDRNTSRPISLEVLRGDETFSIEYSVAKGGAPKPVTRTVTQEALNKNFTEAVYTPTGQNLQINAKLGKANSFKATVVPSSMGANVEVDVNLQGRPWPGVILTSVTRYSDPGVPDRFSRLEKEGRTHELTKFLKLVHGDIQSIKLLTINSTPILHADIGNGTLIPLPFLGEGANCLATALLAIADSPLGVVFLDEIDATVHHTKLDSMWRLLLEACKTFNTQIFATTHSEESLEAFSEAAKKLSAYDDIAYFRLRRTADGKTVATSYAGKELEDTLSQKWEVR